MADKENEATASGTNASFIISIPYEIQGKMNTRTDKNQDDLNEELQTADWLTTGLLDEAKQCYPARDEINNNNGGARDTIALERKLGMVFVQGRIFASPYQVAQFVSHIGSQLAATR